MARLDSGPREHLLRCSRCGHDHPRGWFRRAGVDAQGRTLRLSHCRMCRREADSAHQARRRGAGVSAPSTGLMRRLWIRQRGRCARCGLPLHPTSFHVDHRIPIVKGGEHVESNLQLLHAPCNLQKGAR